MHPQKKIMLWINILGGISVLSSYMWGLTTHPGGGDALWGGMPQWLHTISIADMFLATLGYLTLSAFLFFALEPETAQINIGAGFKAFNVIYATILIPSVLWMPLTLAYIANPDSLLWLADRLVLFIVGLAALGMLSALLNIQTRRPLWLFRLAVAGGIFLAIQTALLDALIWANYFPT